MANALDLVINMRNEKLKREQLRNQSIESGFNSIVNAAQGRRRLDILQQEADRKANSDGSLTDNLIKLSTLASNAKNTNNAPLFLAARNATQSLLGGQTAALDPNNFIGQTSKAVSQTGATAQAAAQATAPTPASSAPAAATGVDIPPAEFDAFGEETEDSKTRRALAVKAAETKISGEQAIAKAKATEDIKRSGKTATALKTSDRNVVTIGSALNDLARTYADGIKEGGLGSLGGKVLSTGIDLPFGLRTPSAKDIGGSVGDKFPASAAFPGKKVEVVARMMPLLTQQGDKEGSVRLVESVFRKLSATLPEEQTGPIAGANMMFETMRNAVRFASAIRQEDIKIPSNEEAEKMPDAELSALAQRIEKAADRIDLSEEEEGALNALLVEVLEPMQDVLVFDNEEAVNRSRLPKGTIITFQGRKARIT